MGRWSGAWARAKVLGSERLKAVCVEKDGPSLIVVRVLGGGVFKALGRKATFLSIWIKVVVVPRSYILWYGPTYSGFPICRCPQKRTVGVGNLLHRGGREY